MKGHRPTYRELEEANVSLTDAVTRLNFKMDRIIEEKDKINEEKDKIIEDLSRRLKYYENENSPPSSDSLEWKRQKVQRKDASTGTDGGKTDRRAPGGQKGHHGVSRQHRPQRVLCCITPLDRTLPSILQAVLCCITPLDKTLPSILQAALSVILQRPIDEEQDHVPIALASLQNFTQFTISESQLPNPQIGVTPNGLMQAVWRIPNYGTLAMNFLESNDIRFVILFSQHDSTSPRRKISGVMAPRKMMYHIREFVDKLTVL